MRTISLIGVAVLVIAVSGALATTPETLSGTVVVPAENRVVLATDEGVEVFQLDEDTIRPDTVEEGDVVVVTYRAVGDDLIAQEMISVDEKLVVTGEPSDRRMAVSGTVTASTPNELLLRTRDGEQAFVLRPEKIRARPLELDSTAAVVYRVEEHTGKDRYLATDIVELPSDAVTAAVEVRTAPVTVAVEDTEPLGAERSLRADATVETPSDRSVGLQGETEQEQIASATDEPLPPTSDPWMEQDDDALPRTAGLLPAILMASVAAFGLAGATRFLR